MNLSKQLVNVIGSVLALGIVAAGVFLIAMPLAAQASTTALDVALVSQTNVGYETQIASLRDREDELPGIEATVAELQRQIPAEPRLDDVFEVVATAAESAGVGVRTATIGDIASWSPREALTRDSLTIGDGSAATGETTTDDSAATGTDATGADPASDPAAAPAGPQQQIGFTVTLDAPSPAQAQRFLDALAAGGRLIGIVHSSLVPNPTSYDLTVNALAFVRAEN